MRNLPDISIRQLEYLVAVADAPTWSIAAADVGVSPSALSQGLAELERRIGVQLFDRLGRRRVLRHSATPVLEHARQVVALTGSLAEWADRLTSGKAGRVRVGMIDIAAVTHFPDAITQFKAHNPDVAFHMVVAPSSTLVDQLRDGALDLIICVAPPGNTIGLTSAPVLTEPLHLIAPANTVLHHPDMWGPWVMFPEDSHTRRQIISELTDFGVTPTIVANSHQPEVLLQMVRLGMGCTVLPLDRPLSPNDFTIGPKIVERQLVVMRRSAGVSDPAVDAFAERVNTLAVGISPHEYGV